MSIRIMCIHKSGSYDENPHEAIQRFGWLDEQYDKTGITSREEMWQWVTDGGVAYVMDAQGRVPVRARSNSRGTRYLQTEADGRPTDNLLALPQCR